MKLKIMPDINKKPYFGQDWKSSEINSSHFKREIMDENIVVKLSEISLLIETFLGQIFLLSLIQFQLLS
jgi:hypothetical protein